jgi:hypothetical protein
MIFRRTGGILLLALIIFTGTVSDHETRTVPDSGTVTIGETVSPAVGNSGRARNFF